MDYKTLISYGNVEIQVIREGHGLTPGVYKVGEGGITAARAIAILKDKKGKISLLEKENETVSKEQIKSESSDVDSKSVIAATSSETKQRRARRSKRSGKSKTGDHKLAGSERSTEIDVGEGGSQSSSSGSETGTSTNSPTNSEEIET